MKLELETDEVAERLPECLFVGAAARFASPLTDTR